MTPLSDNLRGALFMTVSMIGFALNDAAMKLVSDDLDLMQSIFIRGMFATLFVGLLAHYKGVLRVRTERPDQKKLGLRIFGEIGGTFCFLTALFNMPIANATAILQALPLAITLAAAVFLREAVGWRRYLASAIGFCGVLIIVRPGSDGFNEYALFALAAIFFLTIRDLSTRQLSRTMPSLFVSLLTSISIMILGGLGTLVTGWQPVGAMSVSLLALSACFLLLGYIFGVMAMRIGDIGFVSPFRYTILLWAILAGIILFGEIPDVWTLLGGMIVIGTGLFTLYRERRTRLHQ